VKHLSRILRSMLLCMCSALFVNTGLAQSATSPAAPSAGPVTMTECDSENNNNCATWTFLGLQGNGKWPSGEEANLTAESETSDSVTIKRTDSAGKSAGLTATYKGTRRGDRIGGDFTSSWPGHWADKTGSWYATVEHLPQGLPSVMRFCGPAHCGTLNWSNGIYDATYDDQKHTPGGSTFKIQLFTPEAVMITRKELNGGTAVLTGKISAQGNSISNGHIIFTNGSGQSSTFDYQLTWGSALNDARMPGQPQPQQSQPVVVVRPVMACFPWFFTIVCD
jgi:hypothetical protein